MRKLAWKDTRGKAGGVLVRLCPGPTAASTFWDVLSDDRILPLPDVHANRSERPLTAHSRRKVT